MKTSTPLSIRRHLALALCILSLSLTTHHAQPAGNPDRPPQGPGREDPFGPGGPGGPGGPEGFGGPGGPQEEQKLVSKFDQDGDKRLNSAERKAAWEFLKAEEAAGRGRRGPRGPRGGPRRDETPISKGKTLTPADVTAYPNAEVYDPTVLRTFFLEFEDTDWEKEMTAFKNTDIEIPAKVTVDGKVYTDVGVHFRGMSSFMMVGEGRKKSLNLSFDFVKEDQRIGNYRTLEFLNSHDDPSFLRTALASDICRAYIPAPKVSFVQVVINGESWGVYVNAQPFNKDFIRDFFKTTKGARWKVPGSPAGRGSLGYLGDDPEAYRKIYTLKTKEEVAAFVRSKYGPRRSLK